MPAMQVDLAADRRSDCRDLAEGQGVQVVALASQSDQQVLFARSAIRCPAPDCWASCGPRGRYL